MDLSQPGVRPVLLAAGLLLAGLVTYAAIDSGGDRGMTMFVAVCTLPALAGLGLALRNIARRVYGSALAWCNVVLGLTVLPILVSLAYTNLFADPAFCGPAACGQAPVQYWISFGCFVGSAGVTVALLFVCRANRSALEARRLNR